jgi:hypothetical protein
LRRAEFSQVDRDTISANRYDPHLLRFQLVETLLLLGNAIMAARRASTLNPVRKAKKYVKEAVMGVVGTAVVAGLLAAFGINGNNPFTSDPNTPQGKLAKVVEEAAVKAKSKVAAAAHEGKLPNVAPETQKKIEAMLTSTIGGSRTNTTSTSSSDPLVGKWEQLVYNPGNSQWYSGGIFQVSGRPSSYSVAYLDYSRTPAEFVNAAGITDIAFANDEWTFSSKVDANEVLTFKLRRVDMQTFQGYCYQNGQQVAANTWRRVP